MLVLVVLQPRRKTVHSKQPTSLNVCDYDGYLTVLYWNIQVLENKCDVIGSLIDMHNLDIIIIRVFCPRAGPSLLAPEPRLQFC